MKDLRLTAIPMALAMALAVSPAAARDEVGVAALRHVQKIPLPGLRGRIDQLAVDADKQLLYVAALADGSLEAIDLRTGTTVRSLAGLKAPQGVAYLPSLRRVIVANAGGTVDAFDDGTFRSLGTIDGLAGADSVRFDPGVGRLYVGYGSGALAVIDPARMRRLDDVKLPGHPEAFALAGGGSSAYVNVPSKKSVVVVDRLSSSVVSTITLKAAAANYPMVLDEGGHRLFVGTRKPARVIVLDTSRGSVVTSFACVGDAGDLHYDATRERLYVSGGEGFVDVFDASAAGRYLRLAHIPTAPGARTSLWEPGQGHLFVAVPRHEFEDANIRVFAAP